MTEVQFAKQFLTTLDSKTTKYQSDHVFDPKTFELRMPYALPKLAHPSHPLPTKTQASTPVAPGSETIDTAASSSTVTVTLKSARNPSFTLNLPSLPATTPISTLKLQVQSLLSSGITVAVDKIKILHNKKPIPASKSTVQDVVGDGSAATAATQRDAVVEFSVMVMGGASDPTPSVQTITLNNEVEASSVSVKIGPESEKAAAEASSQQLHQRQQSAAASDATAANLSKTRSPDPVQPGELHGTEVLKTSEFWDDLQGFLQQRLRSNEVAAELRIKFENALK